jgi:trans-aconitate methyltransferase
MTNNWDANEGRQQTRLFAKYFLETVQLPAEARTFLDVSCAKGDALPEVHARYPHLQLFAQDISEVAIEEARRSYGSIAHFEVAGFEDLARQYDIILCSNTLEHFENYLDVADRLLSHCRWLYILVPYMEMQDGKPMTRAMGRQHVATFDEHSFDGLLTRGSASRINSWVTYTPGAWGPGPTKRWKKIVLRCLGIEPGEWRQIFYEVSRAAPDVQN